MKTNFWILLLSVIVLVCVLSCVLLLRPAIPASTVRVISEGKTLYDLSLRVDQTLVIESTHGTNTITIQDGKIAVTAADCPDGHCIARGFCNAGAQIVCLPNRLVLQFSDNGQVDGISG